MASDIGEEFMEKTKHKHLGPSDQQRGYPPPPLEIPPSSPGRPIALPDPATTMTDLKKMIDRRTSLRNYQTATLSLNELSYLLWCTQGVKEVEAPFHTFRTVPSAGARHALETYLLINRVDTLAPGLYRFLALDHQLGEMTLDENIASQVTAACLGQAFIQTAAAVFIWAAVPWRMTWRYHQRGYRYLFLDAGHACQNLYLAADSIDGGACAVAAYDDDALNRLLQLDGKTQFVIYLAAVGKK